MKEQKFDVNGEQRLLVLERFKTLNPKSKIMLEDNEITVKELIEHIERRDEFGKKVIRVQIKMLQVLTGKEFER